MEIPQKCAKCGREGELFGQVAQNPRRPMPLYCRSHAAERGIKVPPKVRIEAEEEGMPEEEEEVPDEDESDLVEDEEVPHRQGFWPLRRG